MITIICVVIAVLVFLYYGWETVSKHKEEKLRNSEMYAQAERDLEHIRETRPWGKYPICISFILETGEFCPLEITVYTNKDKELVFPELKPSEFIVAVNMLKKRLYDV